MELKREGFVISPIPLYEDYQRQLTTAEIQALLSLKTPKTPRNNKQQEQPGRLPEDDPSQLDW